MIVYRNATRRITPAALRAFLRQKAASDPLSFLVYAGEAEQAIADALASEADAWGTVERDFRALTLAAADALLARDGALHFSPHYSAAAILNASWWDTLPSHVVIHAPEGFVHYGLDPLAYANAAAAYAADVGEQRAAQALVIGVRSIGTSLSAVVAAALGAAASMTVRPRGATGSRRIRAGATLEQAVRERLAAGGDALIVDEGPGATGETFACVAAWLRALDIPDERIVLFPSRRWGMPLAPPQRQAWFQGTRKYVDDRHDQRPARIAARLGLALLEDLSAGQWRDKIAGAAGAPVNRWHERTKYRATGSDGRHVLLRYAGLGTWGDATVARASRLASHQLGPSVLDCREGFLVQQWIEGAVTSRVAGSLVTSALTYLQQRAPLFYTGEAVDRAPIRAMLHENATEALGPSRALDHVLDLLDALPEREATIADARLPFHEWIQRSMPADEITHAKADSLDHGDGVRLPGPTDLAWDVAGAILELDLDITAQDTLIERVAADAHQPRAALAQAVRAYRAPYAALYLGDATMASWEAAPGPDKTALENAVSRYRKLLENTVRGRTGVGMGIASIGPASRT